MFRLSALRGGDERECYDAGGVADEKVFGSVFIGPWKNCSFCRLSGRWWASAFKRLPTEYYGVLLMHLVTDPAHGRRQTTGKNAGSFHFRMPQVSAGWRNGSGHFSGPRWRRGSFALVNQYLSVRNCASEEYRLIDTGTCFAHPIRCLSAIIAKKTTPNVYCPTHFFRHENPHVLRLSRLKRLFWNTIAECV